MWNITRFHQPLGRAGTVWQREFPTEGNLSEIMVTWSHCKKNAGENCCWWKEVQTMFIWQFSCFFHVYVSHVYVSWVIWMWDESHIPFWPYSSPCSPNKQWSQWSLRKLVPLIWWWTFHAYLHFTRLCFDAPKPPTKNISQTQRTHRCAALPFRGGKNWRLPRQVDELDQRFARIFVKHGIQMRKMYRIFTPDVDLSPLNNW